MVSEGGRRDRRRRRGRPGRPLTPARLETSGRGAVGPARPEAPPRGSRIELGQQITPTLFTPGPADGDDDAAGSACLPSLSLASLSPRPRLALASPRFADSRTSLARPSSFDVGRLQPPDQGAVGAQGRAGPPPGRDQAGARARAKGHPAARRPPPAGRQHFARSRGRSPARPLHRRASRMRARASVQSGVERAS
jgi:hypothetical protein